MQIQVNAADVDNSDAIELRVEEEVNHALNRFTDRITRVEVHLRNLNGPKHGIDKRCKMEARIAGLDPLVVEQDADDLYEAIHRAAKKLERAVKHQIERHEEHKQRTSA